MLVAAKEQAHLITQRLFGDGYVGQSEKVVQRNFKRFGYLNGDGYFGLNKFLFVSGWRRIE
jgi:hypothetical protein